MSRDPFDELRRVNPVSRDRLPGAPHGLADRIIGRRAPWPGWAIAAVAAASVAVVGFGMLWLFDDAPRSPVADGGTTTTQFVTTAVTTTVPDLDLASTVYFFVDTTGESWTSGPYLMPVARPVDGPDAVTGTLQALLDGPTADEAVSVPALSSAVPAGTTINSVAVEDGVVTVDLSSEFASGGGTLAMMGRLGQVVFTLTRLDGIDGVRFEIDGVPTTVFGGEGIIVPDPATRSDFEGLLAAILIESPTYGDFATANPLVARGSANVFEATVSLALTDNDGLIIWEGFTTATCGTGCRGDWEVSIPYQVEYPQMGSLIVWESSARDGSQTNVREHPVWLVPAAPGGTTTTAPSSCSGAEVTSPYVADATLPAEVEAKRAAVYRAAAACDWPTLQSQLGSAFSYTFGIDTDPIAYWQEREAAGDRVMYLLAELLSRPYRFIDYGGKDTSQYVWPSAHGVPWSETTEADRLALLPLYDDAAQAGFAEFGGYIGYRVGILENGTWVFFIAGD